MVEKIKTFEDLIALSEEDQLAFINHYYNNLLYSWPQLAEFLNTYPNKIIRLAKKIGIKFRDRGESQAIALINGRKSHPTAGIHRSESTKLLLSKCSAKTWAEMDRNEKKRRKEVAKKLWEEKPESEKIIMRQRGSKAIRKASIEGSALEFFLREGLTKLGFSVDFHKEHWVLREKLQIDLFVRDLNVAVEVDGPTHFDNIYGQERLMKVQQRDLEKDSLLTRNGFIIIRIRHRKCESVSCKSWILEMLVEELNKIKEKYPPAHKRSIIIDATRDKEKEDMN